MKTRAEFEQIIYKLLVYGLVPTIRMRDGICWYDLNTGMESDLHIAFKEGKFVYTTRYDSETEFNDIEDVRTVGKDCMCSRTSK